MLVDEKFKNWVMSLSQNYKKAQIKAAIHVNSDLIKFYYELGEEIAKTSFKASYGNSFYDLLSLQLKKEIPNCKGLNHQNLRYAEKFYTKYKKIFPQVVGELTLIQLLFCQKLFKEKSAMSDQYTHQKQKETMTMVVIQNL